MSIKVERIDAFRNRSLPILFDIDTTAVDASDLSDIRFVLPTTTKSGLTATDTKRGLNISVDLSKSDLGMAPGSYKWELLASIAFEDTTLFVGYLNVHEPWT